MSKQKGKKKKQSKTYQIISIVLVFGLILYLVFANLLNTNDNKDKNSAMKAYTSIDFKKNGELTFVDQNNEYISKIDIEIAEDDNARRDGLMYRDKMKATQGMFFIFQIEAMQSFWMRNTLIPLDIIFVNSKNKIVTIHKDAIPFDEGQYLSTKPAKFVVEVNAGYTDSLGINEDDNIIWRRTN
ncbi:MAG: DUF192 domain-containing protein [Bacteroidota bacterium]